MPVSAEITHSTTARPDPGWLTPQPTTGCPGPSVVRRYGPPTPTTRLLPLGPVRGGDDGAQRGGDDVRVDADAPEHPVADGALDVGRRPRVPTGRHGVLGVVEHADVDVEGVQRVDERGDGAVAAALDRDRDAGVGQLHDHLVELLAVRPVPVAGQGEAA